MEEKRSGATSISDMAFRRARDRSAGARFADIWILAGVYLELRCHGTVPDSERAGRFRLPPKPMYAMVLGCLKLCREAGTMVRVS